jgi:hypothetical protein
MPYRFALFDTSGLCMSRILTSQEGQAMRLMSTMVSSHTAHPALNTSTFRVFAMAFLLDAPSAVPTICG